MAFDEWMLSKVLNSEIEIILRLYTWSETALTFGFNQNEKTAFNRSNLGQTKAIRRITGGRALIHDPSELTYSIALSENFLNQKTWADTISSSNREISTVLVEFLGEIGIESHYMRKSSPDFDAKAQFHKAPCFESFSKYEVNSKDQKIIASAQRRIKGAILQHGAIKINGAISHPAVQLHSDKYSESKELPKVTREQFEDFSNIFLNSFQSGWGLNFMENILSDEDKSCLDNRQKLVTKSSSEKRKII